MINFRDFISSAKSNEPHYMVVGHPIAHSLSPLMHRAALDYHGLEGDYQAVDLDPGDTARFISWINRDAFLGANITIPYKREFLSVVDRLDETAEAVGALNTIVKDSGKIIGYNTDVDGFRHPLDSYVDRLKGESVILFGTGGASNAVTYALRQLEVKRIVLVSRNPGRFERAGNVLCNYRNWQAYAPEAVMLVNSTPIGMALRISDSPVNEEDTHLLDGKICYDLVYNPRRTRFLKQAQQAGAEIIGGLEMFISQGDRAFELWTGKKFPAKLVLETIEAELL